MACMWGFRKCPVFYTTKVLSFPSHTALPSPNVMSIPPAETRVLGKQNLSSGLSYVVHLSPLAQANCLYETQIVIIEHLIKANIDWNSQVRIEN